jgi:hypothetical protein
VLVRGDTDRFAQIFLPMVGEDTDADQSLVASVFSNLAEVCSVLFVFFVLVSNYLSHAWE